jgi:hypothetical protein
MIGAGLWNSMNQSCMNQSLMLAQPERWLLP